MSLKTEPRQRAKTKIVCTLGPRTESYEMISELVLAGMSVARLNLSHGTTEEHQGMFDRVRRASDDLRIPVGIMVDIPGPKYRTGPQRPGAFQLSSGDSIVLTSEDGIGNPQKLSVYPPGIHNDAQVGGEVLVDDGAVGLSVLEISGPDVACEVLRGGKITQGRGVTTPGKAPSLPFLDDRASRGLNFAASAGADFVALSNVTCPEDVIVARDMLGAEGSDGFIISKIETAEAIERFDDILEASDGIMVARGDLGVAIEMELVPIEQQEMIAKCNRAGKPVITATQMLETMVESPNPTRAEATDVSNAVREGTDAVMLSGETAVGSFPVRAVEVMTRVALRREEALDYRRMLEENAGNVQELTDDAISYVASRISNQLDARAVVAFTESGSTARRVSKYRPRVPILALTPHAKVRRALTVSWGVDPVIGPSLTDVEHLLSLAELHAISSGLVSEDGGKLVVTAGFPFGVIGSTNFLHVMDVPKTRPNPPAQGRS